MSTCDGVADSRTILAIDPGNIESAWVIYDAGKIKQAGKSKNEELIEWITSSRELPEYETAIEMIASYGMPVGKEVFDTCLWIGRFCQAIESRGIESNLVYRKEVKIHLCGSLKAKDSNIRQALIDRYGEVRELAIGSKHKPGPLYGIKKDMWSALAVAITFEEKQTWKR
jgi:hypothetical protein